MFYLALQCAAGFPDLLVHGRRYGDVIRPLCRPQAFDLSTVDQSAVPCLFGSVFWDFWFRCPAARIAGWSEKRANRHFSPFDFELLAVFFFLIALFILLAQPSTHLEAVFTTIIRKNEGGKVDTTRDIHFDNDLHHVTIRIRVFVYSTGHRSH